MFRVLLLVWFMTLVATAGPLPATWDGFVAPRNQGEADRLSRQLNRLYGAEVRRLARPNWWAREASRHCQENLAAVGLQEPVASPAPDDPKAVRFVREYAAEQQRLALLYPKYSSEIHLHPGEEAGWDLPDRHFRLTFDDGPKPAITRPILELLRQRGQPATFYLLGQRIGEAAGEMPDYAGFSLGNHSFDHANLPQLNEQQLAWQLRTTQLAALKVGLTLSRLFRAPYGSRGPRELTLVKKLGLQSVLWNVDSQDWMPSMQVRPGRIAGRTLALMLLHRRGIVLMHDVQPQTPSELKKLLNELPLSGLQIVP